MLANASSPLVRWWIKLNDDKTKIFLISTKPKADFIKDIKFKRIFKKNHTILSYIKLLLKIKTIIKEYQPDIIISHFTIHHGIIGSYSNFHPHISVVYGSDVFLKNPITKFLNKRVLKKSDKIIVSTRNTQQYLNSTFKIKKEKILVQSWGINTKVFNKKIRMTKEFKSQFLEELEISENCKYIFSPRVIRPVYNHKKILEAFSLIAKDYPDYSLIMMFYLMNKMKDYWQQLRDYSRELGIDDKIIWIKKMLSENEMADLYSVSEILINIPKYDQLSSTLLEGLSCGCFVIVSNLKPYYEIVRNHYNGIILSNNDPASIKTAFDEYFKNKAQYQNNALKHSHQIEKKYTLENFIHSIRSIIDTLVNSPK